MSKTLLQTRSLCRSLLDEATAADWTDAELNSYINIRYHQLYTAVINVFEDYYLTTTTFDTVADQQEYTSTDGVPTDVYKIRRVELNYNTSASSSAPTRCLPITNIDIITQDLGQTNTSGSIQGSGNYYTYGHGSNLTIGFIPIPDEAGTDAVKIWYVKQISDLASDSTALDIPYADRYYESIVNGAVSDALRQGQQDEEAANMHEAKFDRGLMLMQQELEDKISEEAKYIQDVSGELLDFS